MMNLNNIWQIFSIYVIAGMGIYVGWHFAKAIVAGLSRGYDWLEAKLSSAKMRLGKGMGCNEKDKA